MSAWRVPGLTIVLLWLTSGCTSPMKIDVGGTCILNSDCNQGLVCTWGKCHDACHTSADCPAGQSCVTSKDQSNVCQLPGEMYCIYNHDCPTGLICGVDQKCRKQCQVDVDCPYGQICTSEQTCVELNHSPFVLDGGVASAGGAGGVNGTSGASGSGGRGATGDAGVPDVPGAQPDVPINGTGGAGTGGTAPAGTATTGGSTATGGSTSAAGVSSFGGTGGTGEATDSASAGPAGLAVIHGSSDYTSSLLSLVDPATGTLVHDNCLNSGSVAPQLSQALSGGVVLPSAPLPGHPLVLIDSLNSALVWLNPTDCTVVRQLSVGTGFKAFPHDVVAVSPNKFYVTRYMTNSSPTADPSDLDEGGDLLILDLDLGKAVGRIDLAPYAAGGVGINPNPDRARVLDGKIYVTLNNFSADMTTQAGPGRVVVVDPTTDTVSKIIDLPAFKECSAIVPVPGQQGALAVACSGFFSDGADQINSSGVALIDTSVSPATVAPLMAAAFGRPLSFADLAVVSSTLAFIIVTGDFSGTAPDQLWQFDFARGVPQKVLDASSAWVLGGLVFDPAAQRLFLGDANPQSPKLHVFDVTVSPPAELASLNSDPAKGLLPRYLGLY